MEEQRYKLKKLVAELSKLRGRHTELVTVYVPAGANLIDTVNQLRNEQGTAENIKSKGTRKNVVSALEKILQHLKLYPKTPVNGLAVFCGNVSEHEGADDIRLWAVEPPDKLEVKRYWCDQKFITEPLEDMVKEKEVFGLLVMDTKEATIGVLRGKKIHVLRNMDSIVPGKTAHGGQCMVLDTLVQLSDGNIVKLGNIKEGMSVKSGDFLNMNIRDSVVLDVFNTEKSKVYKISTKNPRKEIETSKDHFFFVLDNDEIIERAAEELKVGDILLVARVGRRPISKKAFKNFLNRVSPEEKEKMKRLLAVPIIPSKIKSISIYEKNIPMADIAVKYENFIANGIFVHNSAARFARVREGLVNDFYKMIAENMKALMPPEIKGIIIGGPGPSKKEFNDNEYLPTDLQKKILVVKDIGYTDEYGLEELVQRSQDVLSEAAIAHEKALLEKFFVELQKGSGLVVYKPEDIQKALESGAVDMLIVSENARVMRCPSGHFTSDQKCHLCQMKTEEVDATDAFKDIAHQYGTKVEIISRDTREGQQLFNIGGLGATLRWRIG